MKYLSVWFAIPEKRQKYIFLKNSPQKNKKDKSFMFSDSYSADQKS